ncbi:MAG: hypothetical protein JW982_02435 [Spirochaetes bacterium]|nr:hypothetical protein [Spirochaetota bacterium]
MAFKGIDRRKGPDIVVKTFHYLSNIALIINILLLILVSLAKPRMETMFDRFAGSSVSGGWDEGMLFFVLIFLMIQLVVSSFGLLLNATRKHRKKDNYSMSLIFSLFVSIIGFLFMILK